MNLAVLQKAICDSGVHCANCRNQEKGARFRQVHQLEECPKNLPWGYKPAPPAKAPQKPPQANPDPSKWPILARAIRWNRQEGEKGVGSTLKRMLGNVGGDVLSEWYERITGSSCGCSDRAAKLDALYPY